MLPILKEIFETQTVKNAVGDGIPLNSNISFEEGRFLQEMIERHRPKVSLEIGCAYGISSLFICEALTKVGARNHIIIDPRQTEDWQDIGLENIRRAGYADLISFHPAPSHRALPALEQSGLKIDFAFIDGAHLFDYVMNDFFYVSRMLKVGGVVVFDDTWYPSIRSVCRFIASNLPFEVIGPQIHAPSLQHKIATGLCKIPGLGQIAKSRYVKTDRQLGIPTANFLAMRKVAEDASGDGGDSVRHYKFHEEF